MIVALSLSTRTAHETQDCLNHSYISFLASLGCVPLLVPNNISDASQYAHLFGAQALVLTGGQDCTWEVDGDRAAVPSCRDRTERRLLEWAMLRRVPVLGICRGLHFINVFFGGRIEFAVATPEHVGTVHPIRLTNGVIEDLFGGSATDVNSYHNNAILDGGLAPELQAFAVTPNRIIEGARHRTLPIYGLQWHPERRGPNVAANANMVKRFLGLT